jgi:rhamnose transport system ATP-binding protein
MDEPTAPLTPKEVATLFDIARKLRAEERSIVFISHRLAEVRDLCDRVTIFRDGRKVATDETRNQSDTDIIRLMIGRPVKDYHGKTTVQEGQVALQVTGLSRPGLFSDINFVLRKGEILGLGGLVGAGRTDVARALFGIAPAVSGTISVGGRAVAIRDPSDAIAAGLAFVPEDRAQAGIFRSLSVEENITAAIPGRIAPAGVISRKVERRLASEFVTRLRIRLASIRQPIAELSGGNQQKAILARWMLTDPQVLILDEPTRGIDLGVKAEFYEMIGQLAADGRAILLISSELPELLALCDRILVMSEGHLTADISRVAASEEAIMTAAVPQRERVRA